MGRHPDYVEGYAGTLDELAKAIGNMTYDRTGEFLAFLADDLKRQADSDRARGRPILATRMYEVIAYLGGAQTGMEKVWEICEPHSEKIKRPN